MLQIIFAIFMGLACPKHTHPAPGNGTVTTFDIGGEGGHVPPNPPPPKP